VDAVARRVEVASEAISRLHDFARTGSLGVSAVRLDRIVAQAVALLDVDFHAASKLIEVRVRIPDLPQVRGSVTELSLLFVNLLRNARDAMPSGGTVTVTARRQKDCLLVAVTDQGTGMAPEVQARLFEPFFTTKGPSGTGLGLWLAAGTMKRLGGSIRAARTRKGGAAFLLRFPVVKLGRPARSPDSRRGAKPGDAARKHERPSRGEGQSTVRRN
jgi:signal transduction histidine kinase